MIEFAQGAPIYVQLSTLFRRFIVTGQWPVDRQIPTHDTLAVQFDVNPATVRKAIALLEDEGLAARFRRRGTFVIAKPPGAQGCDIPTTWDEALHAYEGLAAETLESRKVKAVPSPFHGGKAGDGYSYARTLYRRERRPVVLEESYAARDLPRKHPLKHLGARARRAETTIRFGIADRDVAALLDIALNAPIAVVHLSVLGAAGVLQFESISYYRGDTVRVAEAIRF
jgi:GntR family transcriptional regulator